MTMTSYSRSQPDNSNMKWLAAAAGVGLVVIAGIAIAVAAAAGAFESSSSNGDDDNRENTLVPTQSPAPTGTKQAMNTLPELIELVCAFAHQASCLALNNVNSSQRKALDWLSQNPNLDNQSNQTRLERYAMATFYYSTNGDDWRNNNNWLSDTIDICQWYTTSSVPVCDGNGNFQILELDNNNLNGTLISDLSLITTLQTLRIQSSGTKVLTGSLPSRLGMLSDMTQVILTGNTLNGNIPVSYSNWAQLQILDLSDNGLSGQLNAALGPFLQATTIDLSGNQFRGPIPSGLVIEGGSGGGESNDNLNLQTLTLDDNRFSSIPNSFEKLQGLKHLGLNRNRLTTFPMAISSMRQLETLDLSFNTMAGGLPTSLSALATTLQDFSLGNNAMTGPLIAQLFELVNLKIRLDLSDNQFTGPLPTLIGNLVQLQGLYLNGNPGLTGMVPSQLANLNQLSTIHIENTGLTGTIPNQVCNLFRNPTIGNNNNGSPTIGFADCQDHEDGAPCFQWCCNSTQTPLCQCRFKAGDIRCFRFG